MNYRNNNPDHWTLTPAPSGAARTRRSVGTPGAAGVPPQFIQEGVVVESTLVATSGPVRRGAAAPALDVNVECAPDERAVVAIRHPSGALTFHAPVEHTQVRRSRTGAGLAATARFRISVRPTPVSPDQPARRGFVSKLLKVVVLKVKEKLVDAAISHAVQFAALGAETLWWKTRGLQEGWFQVDATSLRAKQLRPANPAELGGSDRSLLLLHGTFSHATSAFGELAGSPGNFFGAVREIYGNRIFAYNHFTLSRTPEENAKMILQSLPNRTVQFDAITHSRGGLVLRHLTERSDLFGSLARRFSLGHAVLVASPNRGTPLATISRWEQTIGLVANLLEIFPDNPWTLAGEFVANGIVTLAGHVTQDLPGIASMDADGETIAELQAPPGPRADAYSALVANFNPAAALWQRLLDAGADGFFASANDLVVPTEGGWLVDTVQASAIPPERIGCFGPGGNLRPTDDSPVMHLNIFAQKETVEFLLRALRREAQLSPPINANLPLPTRRLWRGGPPVAARPALASAGRPPTRLEPTPAREPAPIPIPASDRRLPEFAPSLVTDTSCDAFQLMILHGRQGHKDAQVLAMYGSARVLEPFETSNPKTKRRRRSEDGPGTRFSRIIDTHDSIRQCLEGRPNAKGQVPSLPNEAQLREFGKMLFEVLLSGNVRRLYDVARAESRDAPLKVILTCMIPWLAEKPWEFAFDPSRRKCLVTEELHFVRNVLTAVPAQRVPRPVGALRMLVVAAQPVGTVELTSEDEIAVIRHGFQTLIDAGLAQVDVLARATPAALHEQVQTKPYDIVHFIGHGDFDKLAHEGVLLFESGDGGVHEVDTRTLREILCGRGIQLVCLNACESGRDAREELNRGVAQALMEAGLPAVVANQYKVLDPSAVAFAEHFYWSLAQGASLGEASREARIAVNYSLSGEVIDWAVPVVYARDPDFRLTARVVQRQPMPNARPTRRFAPGSIAEPSARAFESAPKSRGKSKEKLVVTTPPIRVAVADLAHAFPDLEETLTRLTAAQNRLQFDAVDIVAPLGTWCVRKEGSEKTPISYLYANRFAERLAKKPNELGVDFLVCITNWPMMCEEAGEFLYNAYGWWDETQKTPIILFSTAGLPLAPRGQKTDRAIANALAATLGGLLAECDTHPRGPKDCPLYFNAERDMNHIQGQQRFDPDCIKQLAKIIPDELAALNAILRVFDEGA